MVGRHKVVVKFGGKEVQGSPFAVSALMKVSSCILRLNFVNGCFQLYCFCFVSLALEDVMI